MRKVLSVLLAILIIASVTVVSFSAADDTGAATVTLKGLQGETVTQTYAVGETFTAYTYMNAADYNEGRIGALDGSLKYPTDVLEIAETYNTDTEDYDYGLMDDMDTVFPIISKASIIGNAGTPGLVYYNASTPAKTGFLFNADTCVLSMVRFKVIASGTATIENTMKTLAVSDSTLTKIISKGVIRPGYENLTTPVALSEPTTPVVTGYTLSGTATSYKTNAGVDDVTLKLTGTDNNYTDTVTVTASYSGISAKTAYAFENVPAGEYTLSVEKGNHVTREYTVAVSADTTQDVKICPIGDADNNGRVNSADAKRASQHANGQIDLKTIDPYQFACADAATPKNRINSADAKAISQHANAQKSLWTVTAE